jgi:hypothetical protein
MDGGFFGLAETMTSIPTVSGMNQLDITGK